MDKNIRKRTAIERKKQRVRRNVAGTSERPRLSVYRSEKHIYGQIIDDTLGRTVVSLSSVAKDLKPKLAEKRKPLDVAKLIGEALAEKAIAAGITQVVFDRNGRRYGGRVKALAEAARGKGLHF